MPLAIIQLFLCLVFAGFEKFTPNLQLLIRLSESPTILEKDLLSVTPCKSSDTNIDGG